MSKNFYILPLFFIYQFFLSCASLNQTDAGFLISHQGSYYCPIHSTKTKAENEAEKDVTAIRCYQDQWMIHGQKILFVRTFFHNKNCNTPIGEVQLSEEFSENNAPKFEVQNYNCVFKKMNPDWPGEENGKCMLNEVPLNRYTSLQPLLSCSRHLPQFCFKKNKKLEIEIEKDSLKTVFNSAHEICARKPL